MRTPTLQVLWLRFGNVSNRILLSRMEVVWPDVIERSSQGENLVIVPRVPFDTKDISFFIPPV